MPIVNAILVRHLPLIGRQVESLCKRLPRSVDPADLHSAGALGLRDAILKFDPARNVKFSTYAPRRITGAMLDWIREQDWMPRLSRRRGDTRRQLSLSALLAPQGTSAGKERDVELVERLEDDGASAAIDELIGRESFRRLIRSVSRTSRTALELYYFDNFTMREIGARIGLSESRVSQLLSQAMLILRAQFTLPEAS